MTIVREEFYDTLNVDLKPFIGRVIEIFIPSLDIHSLDNSFVQLCYPRIVRTAFATRNAKNTATTPSARGR